MRRGPAGRSASGRCLNFEQQAEKRLAAALEALRDERLHSEAEDARSVVSEASRTVTTAKPTALSDASLPSDGGRFLNELTSLLGDVKRMVM